MTSAVFTGIGVVAPNGLGTDRYWQATLAGDNGLSRITRFDPDSYPSTIAGEVADFEATEHISNRLLPQTDHMTRLALTAGAWAIEDAGLVPDQLPTYGAGTVTAASGGAIEFGQRELQNLWSKGKDHVSAYQSFAWFYAVNTGQISIRHKLRGPSGVLVTEQAGALDCLGHARRQIRSGVPAVVGGGVDGALSPWGWLAQIDTGRLSTSTDPARAYRPFASDADGYVPGEGGAILVVEDAAAAYARDARQVYGELAGYAATLDPPPRSGRPSTLRRAIENAVADAGLTPQEVDAVFADGAGVPDLDRAEAAALTGVFGPYQVPVTTPKTMTGRLLAGGAAVDVAAGLLSLRDQVIPPTTNVGAAAPDYGLDLVTGDPRSARLRNVLVVARGYGGFNAAVVLRRGH